LGADLRVGDVWSDRKRRVRHQRPGCSCPRKQRYAVVLDHWKSDEHAGILDLLVTQADFVRREYCSGARAVPLSLVSLVRESAFVDGLEEIPDRLNVVVLEGDVRVIHVDPVPHPGGERIPQILVAKYALAAGGVVSLDAILLDLVAAGQTQLLFDLNFNGES